MWCECHNHTNLEFFNLWNVCCLILSLRLTPNSTHVGISKRGFAFWSSLWVVCTSFVYTTVSACHGSLQQFEHQAKRTRTKQHLSWQKTWNLQINKIPHPFRHDIAKSFSETLIWSQSRDVITGEGRRPRWMITALTQSSLLMATSELLLAKL